MEKPSTPSDLPDSAQPAWLRDLLSEAEALRARGTQASLGQCIELLDAQLKVVDPQSPLGLAGPRARRVLLTQLGMACVELFDLQGGSALGERAVVVSGEAAHLAHELGEHHAPQATLAHATAMTRAGEQLAEIDRLRQALAMIRDLPPELQETPLAKNTLAVALLQLGNASGDRARVAEALDILRCQARLQTLSPEDKTRTVLNLASALMSNARLHRSARLYRELLDFLDQAAPRPGHEQDRLSHQRAQALIELSGMQGDSSLAEEGLRELRRTVDRLEARGAPAVEAHHSRAQAHFQLAKQRRSSAAAGDAIEAIRSALRSIPGPLTFAEGRLPRLLLDLAVYHHTRGRLDASEKDLGKAKRTFEYVLKRLQPERSPWLFAAASRRLFLLHYHQRRWREALVVYGWTQQTWTSLDEDSRLSHQVQSQRALDLSGTYARAAYCHLRLGELAEAADVLDQGRAVVLHARRRLAEGAQDPAEQSELGRAVRRWSQEQQSGSAASRREAWDRYMQALRDAQQQTTAPTSLHLEESIPPGGAIVQLAGIDGWAVAILTHSSPAQYTLVDLSKAAPEAARLVLDGNPARGLKAWDQELQDFSAEVSGDAQASQKFRRWSQVVGAANRGLGRSVLQPVHRSLLKLGIREGATLLLSPAGELASLPLLSAELEDGSAFHTHWEVSLLPSVRLGASAPGDRPDGQGNRMLLVSDPTLDSAATAPASLPFSRREVERIRGGLDRARITSLQGPRATASGVLARMNSASILHVACHAKYEWDRPDQSGVLLHGDTRLTVERMKRTANDPLKLRLISLSCCETGINGKAFPPDEFVGLLPTLLESGARCVIGSLWAIYDDAAMLCFSKFYELFLSAEGLERMSPAAALAQAQRWLREVTLGELVKGGYLQENEAQALAAARFASTRLRHADPLLTQGTAPQRPPSPSAALPTMDPWTRPYASPVDWAGFVILGS